MNKRLLDLQARALGSKLAPGKMVVMELRRREGGREIEVCTAIARPDTYRVTVSNQGNVLYAEGHDGKTAWVSEKRGPARPVTHAAAAASLRRGGLWLAGRRSLGEFIRLRHEVEFLPEAQDATRRKLPAFRLKLDAAASKLLFLDPETGVILVERAEFAGEEDEEDEVQDLELHTLDTRDVEGLRFPRSQQVIDVATGEPIAEIEWLSVEIVRSRADYLSPLSVTSTERKN